MKLERRSEKSIGYGDPIRIKAANAETGIVTGHSSQFWVVDSYGDCTAPGCFQKTVAERGPAGANRILTRYEHEYTVGVKTEMREDDFGLYEESKISDDGMYGTAVRRQLADGVPYGMSIGFYRVASRPANDNDPLILDHAPQWLRTYIVSEGPSLVNVLTEVKLGETSIVSFPAVDTSLVEGYRSEQHRRSLQSLLADLKAGRLSDEEIVSLKALSDAWLADVRSGGGETPPPTTEPQTAVRNHSTEADFLFARMRVLGVTIDGAQA